MKRSYNAFTLTELLVALGVIGILCAILLPIIFSILPNQNTIMAKRAYYAVQTVIADMINDEACYPDKTNLSSSVRRVGFDDGFGYINCSEWNGNIDSEGSAANKFVRIFTSKLDVQEGEGTSTFTTKDGMQWAITNIGFGTKNDVDATAYITIDVNGTESPNCTKKASEGSRILGKSEDGSRTKGFDVFTIGVKADGRLVISSDDTWASDAVKVNKDITAE